MNQGKCVDDLIPLVTFITVTRSTRTHSLWPSYHGKYTDDYEGLYFRTDSGMVVNIDRNQAVRVWETGWRPE